MNKSQKILRYFPLLAIVLLVLGTHQVLAGPLPGAIFTTLEDGTRVNANIYEAKEDVYLDGGPGLNAPSGAAGLPEGDYYFQVTDPSGKVLLSMDAVKCRRIHVNSNGVIDYVYPATCPQKIKGQWVEVDCTHLTGVDVDHADLGAITVQLMPYENTPNNGGVYKVWITPVDRFVGDPELVDNPQYFHGFVPAWSKTDNYKVRRGKPFTAPIIKVRKFNDSDADGIWNDGEIEIISWVVDAADPLSVTNTYYTPAEIQAVPEGIWTLTEDLPDGWMQTALYIDGILQPVVTFAQVDVLGLSGEVHEVIFGNIQLGDITACKFNDLNANGVNDDEPPMAGITFTLEGTNVKGETVSLSDVSGVNGCVTFKDLLPGEYTLCEIMPPGNWMATTEPCLDVALSQGDKLTFPFGNIELGEIAACKFNDLNANGVQDDGEPPMAGITFTLEGTNVKGEAVSLSDVSGADGCVTFADLLPGNYVLCEIMPAGNWMPTTEPCLDVILSQGDILTFPFGNIELGSISACKFHDLNANGINDDEPPMAGITFTLNGINVKGEAVSLSKVTGEDGCVTFADLLPGTYVLCEIMPPGNWLSTTEPCVSVNLSQGDQVSHSFGNIELGSISACKFYDRNANGVNDAEPAVVGIIFTLQGTNVKGEAVSLSQVSGADGCVTFADLLPGNYTLCEVVPSGNWVPTTDTCVIVNLPEGDELAFEFGNMCQGLAGFGTKGYWHNKNGLDETDQSELDYLNSLLPWQNPSTYFDAGDEPIDGFFTDGTLVPEAKNVAGETIAPAGSAWAEQSHFLVDKNAEGDPKEQLAQQLDAFVMNTLNRLDDDDASIKLPDGQWATASGLIAEAISVWAGGTAAEQTAMGSLLDALNNSSAVVYVHYNQCPVVYP